MVLIIISNRIVPIAPRSGLAKPHYFPWNPNVNIRLYSTAENSSHIFPDQNIDIHVIVFDIIVIVRVGRQTAIDSFCSRKD